MPKVTKINGHYLPASKDASVDGALVSRAKGAQKRANRLYQRYHAAVASGDSKKARKAIRALTGSKDFLLSNAIEVSLGHAFEERRSLSDITKAADALSWGAVPAVEAKIFVKRKPGNSFRTAWAFPFEAQIMQMAFRKLISPRFHPREWQYEWNGMGGIAGAINTIRAQIEGGNHHMRTLDIINCFGSFNSSLTEVLKLPKSLVDRYVLGGKYLAAPYHTHISTPTILNQARQGIPLGSLTSPLVVGLTISKLKFLPSISLVNWVDDFALVGPSKEVVDSHAEALVAAVAALPGGHFTLRKRSYAYLPEDELDFLGHHFSMVDGLLEIEPEKCGQIWTFLCEMDEALAYLTAGVCQGIIPKAELVSAAGDGWSRVLSWATSFKACNSEIIDSYLDCAKIILTKTCRPAMDWAEVKQHHNPKCTWSAYYFG